MKAMYQFLASAVIDDYKLGGFKQQKQMISEVWNQGVYGHISSGGSRGESVLSSSFC